MYNYAYAVQSASFLCPKCPKTAKLVNIALNLDNLGVDIPLTSLYHYCILVLYQGNRQVAGHKQAAQPPQAGQTSANLPEIKPTRQGSGRETANTKSQVPGTF